MDSNPFRASLSGEISLNFQKQCLALKHPL
jgi:hypothetical protein